ncbi:MAG: HigA family addiction module antitoxin [Thermodesulfobacteriota bacterium]
MSDIIYPPIHPGEILLEEFMEPLGLTQNQLARDLGVDPGRINRIVTGKCRITADTALRLARYFGTTPQLWLNLQTKYDLELAMDEKAEEIEKRVKVFPREELEASSHT